MIFLSLPPAKLNPSLCVCCYLMNNNQHEAVADGQASTGAVAATAFQKSTQICVCAKLSWFQPLLFILYTYLRRNKTQTKTGVVVVEEASYFGNKRSNEQTKKHLQCTLGNVINQQTCIALSSKTQQQQLNISGQVSTDSTT